MPDPEITLVRADASRKLEFLEMAEEFLAHGDERFKPLIDDPKAYFERLERFHTGTGLEPGNVPSTLFLLERGGRIIGQSALRHELNDNLRTEGGHIGYSVRPGERQKGYGTLILKLTMEEARKIGLTRVLITCDTDNIGSMRIIENNGGVLESQGTSKISGKMIDRYWIEISA